ncbi:MAG: TolC family protein, partial [Bacteroidota bacterium]
MPIFDPLSAMFLPRRLLLPLSLPLLLAWGMLFDAGAKAQGLSGSDSVPAGGWTLEQCIRYALKNNITLRQGDLAVASAHLDQKAARLAFTPSVNGSAGLAFNNGRAIDPFTNTFINQTV